MKTVYLVIDDRLGYSWEFNSIEERDLFVKENRGSYRFETEEAEVGEKI